MFVSGAGPVGCLIAAVARLNGAASVAISDMEEFPLSVAVRLGADAAFKAADPALADLANGCEACFEASGSVGGMNTCLRSAAPGGSPGAFARPGRKLPSRPPPSWQRS